MRIGVAMAIYNGRRFLREQIDSLLRQTMPPDIIVCCDDGSSDDSLPWLQEYIRSIGKEARFLLVKNEKNLGYIQNFYHALDLCDADLLFLCDQDDIWAEDKLEQMAGIFEKRSDVKLLSCAHVLIGAQGEVIESLRYSQKSGSGAISPVCEKDIVTFFRWPGMTMAMRRDFWCSVRGEACAIAAPHDRVLALIAASQSAMYYFDRPLCSHRLHTSNSGGEENSMRTYLARDFKLNELQKSLQWLDAQLLHKNAFSVEAAQALSGYRRYIAYRLEALDRRSILPLIKALGCKGFVNVRGIAADLFCLISHS